jgi:hypothetical protein
VVKVAFAICKSTAKPAVVLERLGLGEEEGKKREGRGAWTEARERGKLKT